MIITFFGHRNLIESEQTIYFKIEKVFSFYANTFSSLDFYCGHKGKFDYLCEKCIDSLKIKYPNIQKIYITPYLSINHQKHFLYDIKNQFDDIIFPVYCEKCPPKFAYSHRNRWMIDQADIILSYVRYSWGGAASAIEYAKKKNKCIIDI